MSASEFNILWKAIDVLEAQETLVLSRTLMTPHLKRRVREERDRKIAAAAFPKDIYKKELKDSSYLLEKLGGRKNGRR